MNLEVGGGLLSPAVKNRRGLAVQQRSLMTYADGESLNVAKEWREWRGLATSSTFVSESLRTKSLQLG